jgi:hypothetical protein
MPYKDPEKKKANDKIKSAEWYARNWAVQQGRKIGLSGEEYQAISDRGICEVCSSDEPLKGRTRLHVDHNHATGVVRGLLCHRCNISLGNVGDSKQRLQDLIDYLERYE